MRSNRLITALVLIAPPLTLALWSSLIVAGAMPNSPQAQGAPPSRKDYFLPPCPPLNKMETRRDHSAHAAMAKMVYSTVGLYRRPTTVRQFLSNLKIAADRRLVVQPQFAEERSLKVFLMERRFHSNSTIYDVQQIYRRLASLGASIPPPRATGEKPHIRYC